jgi:hypothetical protein
MIRRRQGFTDGRVLRVSASGFGFKYRREGLPAHARQTSTGKVKPGGRIPVVKPTALS